MSQPDISQILTEAEAARRQDRARSAQAVTVAQAASGDYTTGQAATGVDPGNLVTLDANGKISPSLLYPAAANSQSRTYDHVQQVASTTWTIAHMLDGYPPVILPDPASSTGRQRYAEVHYPDANHVIVIFGRPRSGVAHLSL